jgi:hypothetical protein
MLMRGLTRFVTLLGGLLLVPDQLAHTLTLELNVLKRMPERWGAENSAAVTVRFCNFTNADLRVSAALTLAGQLASWGGRVYLQQDALQSARAQVRESSSQSRGEVASRSRCWHLPCRGAVLSVAEGAHD